MKAAASALPADRAAPSADSLGEVVGFRLRRLQSLFVTHWAQIFRDLEPAITPVQGGIVYLVEENPGLSQIELAGLLRIEAPTLLQSLHPLIRAGLVTRYRSPQDRRAFALHLSRTGREMRDEIAMRIALQENGLLAGLTPQEREQFRALLDRALESAEAAVATADDMRASWPKPGAPPR
jgi:DNA-binding MarR family transcriptional regulator